MLRQLAFCCALIFAAGAPRAADLYLVETLAQESAHAPVRAAAHELELIYADLARASGVDARLVWSTDPDVNAFATEVGDERIVVVQFGLLQRFEDDRDAVAATLGHELAHHRADHIRSGHRKQQNMRVLGTILGAVVGAKVGRNSGELAGAVSGAAVGVGADLLALKFSRNQELEADRLALEWMVQTDYNPAGMLRLQQRLGEMAGERRRAAILSTHPTSSKRYQAAQKRIAALAPDAELVERPRAPLVDARALAAARGAILDAALAQQASRAPATTVAASTAPSTALQPAATPPADTSGVRIGESVKIGRGVRIGGREVAPSQSSVEGSDDEHE